MKNRKLTTSILAGVCASIALAPPLSAQRRHRGAEQQFAFRFVGPRVGNRVAAVAGIPGDTSTYYAGAASGGVWKSTDGGNDWRPIFDKEPAAAIGALAVSPSEPNIVWAGTGEAWAIRDIDVAGDGIYKSTDAGKTWTNMGLPDSGRIGRIVVDPRDANNVYACVLGRLTAPGKAKGVYRTTDGGKTWVQSLFVNEETGCSGLSMDAHDSQTLVAGMWQVEMHTWGEFSGGPGSGVYISHDGGTTWKRIEGHGLPKSPVGKVDVAIAPTDPNRVYALIETRDEGSFWRSDDGGANWRLTSWDRTLIGRGGYYIRIAVSPGDENKVLVANSGFYVTLDGGETFREQPWGGDNHDIWMDPKNPDHFMISFDGGLAITTVNGRGFKRVTLPIGQMYHVAVDNQVPYYVYTNMQDNSTMRGPSIPREEEGEDGWDHGMGGCESGFTLPDPTDPNIVWASCYADEVTRWDARSRQARSVSPYLHTLDAAPNQIKYRCHWTPPLAIDPFDHNTVYYGCQVIFKTTDSGQSWKVDSPDLSTHDPSRIVSSGGLIGDNLGQFYGEVVFAIAPSKIEKGLVWAGTDDGKVWYTRDGGGHWTDVTANMTGMPAWGEVTSIEPSHFQAGTAYVSLDFHLVGDRDPYIYKTTDFGKSWTRINNNMPKGPLAYMRNISEDPNTEGLLFAGTGDAFYYSLNDGGSWTHFDAGLPPSPVTWTVVQKNFHDLVVSTYGRGIYILDDITPLEQMAAQKSAADVRVFTPRKAYRLRDRDVAFVDFALKDAAKKPVQMEILDAHGDVIRTLRSEGHAGVNRMAWDMRYEGPRTILLRTVPPEDPHIWEEERFKGKDERPITHWGMSPRQQGPLAAPGEYTARLTVDGATFKEPLEIVMDPHSSGSQQGIEASLQLQLRIRKDVNEVSDMVNQIEWMRKQLTDVEKMLAANKADADLLATAKAADGKMQDVEYALLSKSLAASDDKYYESAYKVYFNLLWLNAEVGSGAGDVAGAGDYGPTATTPLLLAGIEKNMAEAQAGYETLMKKAVPALNQTLSSHGVIPVVAVRPRGEEEAQ